jgi:four helix bundle protein
MEFVEAVYVLSRDFLAEERFALTNQLRRAAVSIPSNIAEGDGRFSKPDFNRFLSMADEVDRLIRGLATSLAADG